jgi:hypothetical protein
MSGTRVHITDEISSRPARIKGSPISRPESIVRTKFSPYSDTLIFNNAIAKLFC